MGTVSRNVDPYAQRPFKSVETFNLDGLELARVRRVKRREWPVRQFFLFLLAVLSFKVFLALDMGAGYGAKVEEFRQGGALSQAAAWVMHLDPVSAYLVEGFRFGNW